MIIKKFTIIPKKHYNESLTSYLGRVANLNGMEIRTLVNMLSLKDNETKKRKVRKNSMHIIDVLPDSVLDIEKLCNLVDMKVENIKQMTYEPIMPILSRKDNSTLKEYQRLMSTELEKNKRKICNICMKEGKGYKLIWQIKSIIMCNIHECMLETKCNKCGKDIPYLLSKIASTQCENCNGVFYNNLPYRIIDNKVISEQLNLYDDWFYLMSDSNKLFQSCDNSYWTQSLAVLLLYYSQDEQNNETFDFNEISFFSNGWARILYDVAIGKKFKHRIILSKIFDLCNYRGIRLKDLDYQGIKDSYVKSMFNYSKNINLGPCLSPWCNSYGSNINMKEVQGRSFFNQKYTKGSVCQKCFMKYGYNKLSNIWESINNETELIWNMLLPGLRQGLTKSSLMKQLKLGVDSVNKAYGYILSHNLLDKQYQKDVGLQYSGDDLVDCFKRLSVLKGDMIDNAKTIYGWSTIDYYYFFSNNDVQRFLIFERKIDKRGGKHIIEQYDKILHQKVRSAINECIENCILITKKSIAEKVGCSFSTLERNGVTIVIKQEKEKQYQKMLQLKEEGLIEDIVAFLILKYERKEIVSFEGICKELCKKEVYIRKNFKSSIPKMHLLIKNHNQSVIDYDHHEKKLQIKVAIKELYACNAKVTMESVANYIGVRENEIKSNKDLKQTYLEVKYNIPTKISNINGSESLT